MQSNQKQSSRNYITIDGFEKMTRQEMFDMAARHITETGCASLTKTGNCCYSGSGCNASPFIKPDKRSEADRHGSWHDLVGAGLVSADEEYFISDLQFAHDSADGSWDAFPCDTPFVEKFRKDYYARMILLAGDYELNFDSMTKFKEKYGVSV